MPNGSYVDPHTHANYIEGALHDAAQATMPYVPQPKKPYTSPEVQAKKQAKNATLWRCFKQWSGQDVAGPPDGGIRTLQEKMRSKDVNIEAPSSSCDLPSSKVRYSTLKVLPMRPKAAVAHKIPMPCGSNSGLSCHVLEQEPRLESFRAPKYLTRHSRTLPKLREETPESASAGNSGLPALCTMPRV